MIKVVVAGAAGKMGTTTCAAVESAPDMELIARADPVLGARLEEALADADVVVDFTRPDTALANVLACVEAGVHVVVGTTGFAVEALLAELGPAPHAGGDGPAAGRPAANVLIVPNFAIGAVLMMRFAAIAAARMAKAEIIELHHDQKLDAPSGTAKLTAELMAEAIGAGSGPAPPGGGSGPAPPGAGSGPAPPGGIPIHSVRLPGLVANQEVIFGDVGQTLTIRHDTTGREAFMPGVLLAVRRVGELNSSPVIGLESLLF